MGDADVSAPSPKVNATHEFLIVDICIESHKIKLIKWSISEYRKILNDQERKISMMGAPLSAVRFKPMVFFVI